MVGGHDPPADCQRLPLRGFGFVQITGIDGRSGQIVEMDEVTC
jgi:hypothetical protein